MNHPMRCGRAALCAAIVLAGAGLSACVPALVGGAVGAGALLMTADRRSGETQEADRVIEATAQERVVQALPGRGHVTVTSYYRKVLLTGEVPTEQDRQTVATLASALPGVQGVINELAVMPDASALQRSSDSLTTSKVRARLIQQNGVPAGSIRLVTERGTTYLMGRLTPQEAALATEVTRQTDGVQRVVRVIDFIADPAGAGGALTTSAATPAAEAAPAPANGDTPVGVQVQPVASPAVQPAPAQPLPPAK